jgi:hypothetical protein
MSISERGGASAKFLTELTWLASGVQVDQTGEKK